MLPPPAGEDEEKMSWLSGREREEEAEGRPSQLLPIASHVRTKEGRGEKLLAFAKDKISPGDRR